MISQRMRTQLAGGESPARRRSIEVGDRGGRTLFGSRTRARNRDGAWTRDMTLPGTSPRTIPGRIPQLRVPMILRRPWAWSLLCVLWMTPVDRALAGVGVVIAAGSAAFATGMILRAGSAQGTFTQPRPADTEDYSTISCNRDALDGFGTDCMGSMPRPGVDAEPMGSQPPRLPAVEPPDRRDRPGHRASSYVLRYANVGAALLHGPGGTLVVVPGSVVPDAGTVHSIEKRAGHWVVMTEGGPIGEPAI